MNFSVSEGVRRARKLSSLVVTPEYRRALRLGVAATVEHRDVPFRSAPRTVVDVGAGRGQFGLFASHRFPGARILGFEPLPDSFATAQRVLAPHPTVDLRQVAIAAASGRADIYVTSDRDSSSLLSPTGEQTRRFPGTGAESEVEVEVRTLDELVSEPTAPVLLKLDLQGGELDALRGAEKLLEDVDEVFAECSFVELYKGQPLAEEVIVHLSARGLHLAGIFSPTYGDDGECIQADLLFRRRPPSRVN